MSVETFRSKYSSLKGQNQLELNFLTRRASEAESLARYCRHMAGPNAMLPEKTFDENPLMDGTEWSTFTLFGISWDFPERYRESVTFIISKFQGLDKVKKAADCKISFESTPVFPPESPEMVSPSPQLLLEYNICVGSFEKVLALLLKGDLY